MSKKIFEEYIETFSNKLLYRTPIVIHLNGRSFRKVTSFVDKPFSSELNYCFKSTLSKLCLEVEGCVFGYTFNDEIVLILRNDQHKDTVPWYDNKIQKINSVVTSIATYNFTTAIHAADLPITNQAIFINQVFNLPKIHDCITYLTMCQTKNFIISLNNACEYELLNNGYSKEDIKNILNGLSIDERKNILLNNCNIEYMDYPVEFRRGVACYKQFDSDDKAKWIIDSNINIFGENSSWLADKLNFITY